jgi:acetyl esterase/lipase
MTTRRSIFAAFSLTPLLLACAPVRLFNTLAPRGGYRVQRDLAYGTGARHRLDVYLPDKAEKAPIVVFFYGGNWRTGDKDHYRTVGGALASRGIVAVIPDYRLYPEIRFPAFIEDAAAAVAFVRRMAASFGADPQRLFLAGHSAGAYNAVLLGCDARYLGAAGVSLDQVAGVIGIAGPYDFLPLTDPALIELFGGAARRETLPITYAAGTHPPMLLVTGDADTTVSPGNTTRMAASLRAGGTRVEERHYPGVGHIGIILAFAPALRGRAPVLDDIVRFVTGA